MPKALITGITGQDGSYLAEFLLSKGYEVHGIIRRASTFNTGRLDHIYVDPHAAGARMFLHYGDLSDGGQLTNLIYNVQPDEIYHLGAQSHVRVSFDIPEYTGDVTGLGTTRILESLRRAGGKARYYQASSSEMFGATPPPQGEKTPFYPRSPYGAAKVYSYWMAINYREAYNMFASNGILFNHESPRRGETFVTRKITRAIAKIKAGKQKELFLGNLDARRDWGFAYEYVAGDVAHPAARPGGRFRRRHRPVELGEGVPRGGVRLRGPRLEGVREDRPEIFPADGSGEPDRRRLEGEEAARLGAEGDVQGARADHGRRRPGGRGAPDPRRGPQNPRRQGPPRRLETLRR